MTNSHPDLPAEQEYIDHAVGCLEAAQRSAQQMIDQDHAGSNRFTVREIHAMGEELLKRRNEAGDRICFARIDSKDGQTVYIGREQIRDTRPGHTKTPVVISWHVPAADRYYEATPDAPLGLVRKRRLELEDTRLVGIEDEVYGRLPARLRPQVAPPARKGERAPVKPVAPPAFGDSLLRELERARGGEMRDIVPTIQRDQHALIRASREGVLVIQGGPGTGKTAVALHRAVWLAFNHARDLGGDQGILVVGPNQAFMEYISAVLPGLGGGSVAQAPIDRLVVAEDPTGRTVRATREDAPDLARLKGDPRLADVIANCVEQRVRAAEEAVTVTLGGIKINIEADEVRKIIRSAWGRGKRRVYMEARGRFRRLMREAAAAQHSRRVGGSLDEEQLQRALNATSGPWFNALQRIWPTMSAPQLIHELFTIERRMSNAADRVLDKGEQEALMRKEVENVREQPWTTADLPLVDEADALLYAARSRARFGYVIADEAQDLTPMQLRMVRRRARGGDLTLVGDIAQGTGPWAYGGWDEILANLPDVDGLQEGALNVGYRVPAPIIEFASHLLPRIASGLEPVLAVRPGRDPVIAQVRSEKLADAVAKETERLREGDRSLGVIVPPSLVRTVRAALADARIQVGDIERDALQKQVTLLPSHAAKGLEFDHVIVVEPIAVVDEAIHGMAELYVALTRATQRLSVIHTAGLPAPLPGGREPDAPKPPFKPAKAAVDERASSAETEVSVMPFGGRFSEALVFAKLQHGQQARRGTAVPYFAHVLGVCALVLEDGGSEQEAIAALLHDAAEDHGREVTIGEIEIRFGPEVAGIVALCTDPPTNGEGWRATKREHLEILEGAPVPVRRVALAEKLDNARAIVRELREVGSDLWPKMGVDADDLLWYFDEAAALFARAYPGAMAAELQEQVGEMWTLVTSPEAATD